MGWSDCGVDSQGRPIGYAFEATCDHPECDKAIDRGLAYACGGMHGSEEFYCEGYFCENHLYYVETSLDNHELMGCVCLPCSKVIERDYPATEEEPADNTMGFIINLIKDHSK